MSGASPASLCCGPSARHIYPSLVLVQPRKIRPCLIERLLMGHKNQIIQNLNVWLPFCSADQNRMGNFVRGPYKKHLCDTYFEYGPVVQEEIPFLESSYLELCQLSGLAELF